LRSRTMEQARVALASRSQAAWLDPRYLGVVMQVGKSVGMKRLLPLIGVGLLAAGLAKEWAGRRDAAEDQDPDDEAESAGTEPSFGNASGARASAARARRESSSMRRMSSSGVSNLSSGLIQSMKAISSVWS